MAYVPDGHEIDRPTKKIVDDIDEWCEVAARRIADRHNYDIEHRQGLNEMRSRLLKLQLDLRELAAL